METQREINLRRLVREFFYRARDAHGADGDRRASHVEHGLVRERSERGEHLAEVIEGFAHAHHDDVARAGGADQSARVPHLFGNLARGEVREEAHRARLAEGASHRAPDLGRDAHGVASGGGGGRRGIAAMADDHRLHEAAVVQADDELGARAVGGDFGVDHLAGAHDEVVGEERGVARGDVRCFREVGLAAAEDLAVQRRDVHLLDAVVARETLHRVQVEEAALGWVRAHAEIGPRHARRTELRAFAQPPSRVGGRVGVGRRNTTRARRRRDAAALGLANRAETRRRGARTRRARRVATRERRARREKRRHRAGRSDRGGPRG